VEDITDQVRAADATAALFGGVLGLGILAFLVALIVVWTFLPFAIFGTKPILRDIADTLKRIEARQITADRKASIDRSAPPKLTQRAAP
jgi:hypothetical protein